MTALARSGSLQARRALPADLGSILALLADDDLGRTRDAASADDPACRAAFAAIDGDANQLLLVAELDGHIVATMQLCFFPGLSRRGAWRAQIEGVRVSSTHRGRGIGAWLVEHALDLARQRGCALAQLTSDVRRTRAHAFYEKLGFARSHVGLKRMLDT